MDGQVKKLLKLTGGSFSGRRLYVPDSGVRPASNLVREALFATLNSLFKDGVAGLRILDLFAGSGSLGLEAISRGAELVTFVDNSVESVKSIRRNMEILGFSGQVIRRDVRIFLKRSKGLDYDLIFMDPPYRFTESSEVVSLLWSALRSETAPVLVHERYFRKGLPDFGECVQLVKRKKYGQTELLYYRFLNEG
jgi:16S rRNA (guanine966-N2)-methyltransferase